MSRHFVGSLRSIEISGVWDYTPYMTNYSSVIIDFDGTLFDTRRAISATLYETFAAYNVPPPSRERVEALIGRGVNLEETLTHLMPQSVPAALLNEWVMTYRRIYNSGTGIRASTPFPGSRDALAELHAAGVPIVIASNKGEASVHAILTHFGMHDFVQLIIAARDAYPTKPDPRSYFDRIAPVLGTAASEHVLVAGDTDLDILYARRIGATACWAAYGYGDPDECRMLHPEFIAASPNEIAHAVCAAPPP
jgi:phosphoglycolate phosphatase